MTLPNATAHFDWSKHKSATWTADAIGASITGRIERIEVRKGKSGDVPVLALSNEDGTREVWAAAADLRSKLADLAPQVGEHVRITYTGDQQVGQPSPMKLFTVERVLESF